MDTTAIVVELFIGGIQASIWISLLAMSLFGYDWVLVIIPHLEKWVALVTVITFAFWYTLGIIIDRFAHALFGLFSPSKLMKKSTWIDRKAQYFLRPTIRTAFVIKEGEVTKYLEYFSTRRRIMRATALNFLLTTGSALLFIFSKCSVLGCSSIQGKLIFITILIGIALVIMALLVLGMLDISYEHRLAQLEEELKKIEKHTT